MKMETSQLKQKGNLLESYQEAVESTEDFEARFEDRQGHTESRDLGKSMAMFSQLQVGSAHGHYNIRPMMSLILSILVLFKIQNPERDHSIGHS